jgi:hypothetical protein
MILLVILKLLAELKIYIQSSQCNGMKTIVNGDLF